MISAATNETETEIDRKIIWAFGNAQIQSEATLLFKLRAMSLGVPLDHETFLRHLGEMKGKGYVAPFEFNGMQCWRKLVDDIDEEDIDVHEGDIAHVAAIVEEQVLSNQ